MPGEGIEPPTFGLQNRCSTAELIRRSRLNLLEGFRGRSSGANSVRARRRGFSNGLCLGTSLEIEQVADLDRVPGDRALWSASPRAVGSQTSAFYSVTTRRRS